MGLSPLQGTVSCHILPPSTCSTCGTAMFPGLSHGSAPSSVTGTLPWKCNCPSATKSSKKGAEHPLNPLCRSRLLCPHSPSSRIILVLGWVYSSPSLQCMWKRKASASFPKPLHLLVTTGKYQDLGKTLSMCMFPSTLSHSTLKIRRKFLSFLLACFLLPMSGNWGVTGPFVMEGTAPLHLPVLPWFFCCSGSSLESVLCVWKALHAYNPRNSIRSSFACYTNFTSTLQYLEIFVTSGNITTASCGKNNPVPPLAMLGWTWVMQMTAMQRLGTSFCSLLPQASSTTLLSVQNILYTKSCVLLIIFTSGYSSGKPHIMLLELKYYCKCF